jgi:hypothetical protein
MPNPFAIPASLISLFTVGSNASPAKIASPVTVTDFTTSPLVPSGGNPWGECLAAVTALAPASPTYGDGVRLAYQVLTSAPAEGSIGCFAARALATRQAKKLTIAFAQGAMDVYRLIMEQNGNIQNTLNVLR